MTEVLPLGEVDAIDFGLAAEAVRHEGVPEIEVEIGVVGADVLVGLGVDQFVLRATQVVDVRG